MIRKEIKKIEVRTIICDGCLKEIKDHISYEVGFKKIQLHFHRPCYEGNKTDLISILLKSAKKMYRSGDKLTAVKRIKDIYGFPVMKAKEYCDTNFKKESKNKK